VSSLPAVSVPEAPPLPGPVSSLPVVTEPPTLLNPVTPTLPPSPSCPAGGWCRPGAGMGNGLLGQELQAAMPTGAATRAGPGGVRGGGPGLIPSAIHSAARFVSDAGRRLTPGGPWSPDSPRWPDSPPGGQDIASLEGSSGFSVPGWAALLVSLLGLLYLTRVRLGPPVPLQRVVLVSLINRPG
jgi:hypothetical protein